MRRNYKLNLKIESELIEDLKKEAEIEGITMAGLCRKKLRKNPQLIKIELILESINNKLNKILEKNE